ncbi:endonuclease domain-containing protein [Corynebacterium sp. S7]
MADTKSIDELAAEMINLRTVQTSNDSVWDAIARGDLVPISSQWYLPSSLYKDLEWFRIKLLRAIAVGLTARKAVIAGRSAARLQGIWVVSLTEETVELIVPSGAVPAKRDRGNGITYHYAVLKPHDFGEVKGVRYTVALRTVIDICRFHGVVEGIIACDWALSRGYEKQQLTYELTLMGRRKGVAAARTSIAAAISTSESPFESLARALLIEAGVTGIIPQAQVDNFRVDLLVQGFLIIEIDGDTKYEGDQREEAIFQERNREKNLLNKGFRVLRYRPRDMLKDPQRLVADVQAALAAEARRRGQTNG